MKPNDQSDPNRSFIDEPSILEALGDLRQKEDRSKVPELLAKARELKGLDANDVTMLMSITAPGLVSDLSATARYVKEAIYGPRILLFALLYVSNLCKHECLYCAFHESNTEIRRRALSQEEIAQEVHILINQGHKRLLLVAGEGYLREGFGYILKTIETICETRYRAKYQVYPNKMNSSDVASSLLTARLERVRESEPEVVRRSRPILFGMKVESSNEQQ